jgi:hypothetical protein
MTGIPSQVLSQHLRELLSGRRVTAAVFMTFTLEPQFFEQEIVTLLAGDQLIQDPRMRMLQLEEMLRGAIGPVAVYYDSKGLRPDGAKQLDIRYVPLTVPTGLFHPKLVLLLTEDEDADRASATSLICGVLSSNLTKAGWWSSVECAHFETVIAGERCGFRDELTRFLGEVRRLGGVSQDHEALDRISTWVRREAVQAQHATDRGWLRTRLVAGTRPMVEFLDEVVGSELSRSSLEIVAPFVDESRPGVLDELITAFELREVRVFLPTAEDGSGTIDEEIYEYVKSRSECAWSRLPQDLLKLGKDANAKPRGVHAKVYRFHRKKDRYEALVVGSHNLTVAAHGRGGNVEASFLVERELDGPIEWWLTTDAKRPPSFTAEVVDDERPAEGFVPLQLAYDWSTGIAKARWHGAGASPRVRIEANGHTIITLSPQPPDEWVPAGAEDAKRLEDILVSTTILDAVTEDGTRAPVLVQEYGMSRKPSLVATWSIADVLEYWSRLTAEQRAAFLAARIGNVPEGVAEKLDAQARLARTESFFTSAAGIFHGFEMLRKQVVASVKNGKDRQADYQLFGKRHDSLPNLIDKACSPEGTEDAVQSYLVLLCARQLSRELRRRREPFFSDKRNELAKLEASTKYASELATRLELGKDGAAFLKWFERHFLRNLRNREVAANG